VMWLWVLAGAVLAPTLLGLYQVRKGAGPGP
jgi:hypothetical protein